VSQTLTPYRQVVPHGIRSAAAKPRRTILEHVRSIALSGRVVLRYPATVLPPSATKGRAGRKPHGATFGIGYVNKNLYACPAQPHVVCHGHRNAPDARRSRCYRCSAARAESGASSCCERWSTHGPRWFWSSRPRGRSSKTALSWRDGDAAARRAGPSSSRAASRYVASDIPRMGGRLRHRGTPQSPSNQSWYPSVCRISIA